MAIGCWKNWGLTWPQIGYWSVAGLLMIAGIAAIIGAQWIELQWVQQVIGEIGVAILIAGILAALVEPFFRKEFARDAFLAAFRYVLPIEFRDEIEKIMRNEFIGESQIWTVEIKPITADVVLITTSFDKVIVNKTSSTQQKSGYYTVPEFHFPQGKSQIIECGIEGQTETVIDFNLEPCEHVLRAETKKIDIRPGKSARIWGKATQYRRSHDIAYETFTTPVVDPEIEVIIPDDMEHVKEFGTIGDVSSARYTKRYKLSGVYFPGQYMLVQWWPKPKGQSEAGDMIVTEAPHG